MADTPTVERPDRLAALADTWQERAERYAARAREISDDKPLDALRLGTYALQWNLAARELRHTLGDVELDRCAGLLVDVRAAGRHLESVK